MTTRRGRVAMLVALVADATGCGSETIEPDELSGRVAFTGFRDGNAEIYVADRPDSLRAAGPVWSPDAEFVTFVAERFGLEAPGELFVVAADGSGATPLDIERAGAPAWTE